ncbi:MAG: glycosyltransferase family 4 protein, partial [Rubrobacter sp.]
RLARELAGAVGPIELRQMTLRHGLVTPAHRSISGTAGSDDHGGIYGGATYTVASPGIGSPGEFLEALAGGDVRPAGEDGSVEKLVQTGFRLAAAAIEEDDEGQAVRVVRRFALRPALLRRLRGVSPEPEPRILKHVPLLARLGGTEVKRALASRYEKQLSDSLGNVGSGFPALDFFSCIGSFMDGHTYIALYVALHGYFGREERKANLLRREVLPDCGDNLKVGVFVDGIEAVHGVSTMYRNVQLLAEREHAGALEVVRCGVGSAPDVSAATSGSSGGTCLRAVATLPVPLYDGLTLGVPSLLEVIEHVAAENYDALHVATPGPLGLAALVAGLVLGTPVVGAYHTEFGAYAGALSGDAFVAEIVEVAVREFYERCSVVAVPSQATALALRNRGYRIGRFEVLKNGVDAELFDPAKRDSALVDTLGGGRKLVLYAGRVSKEKELGRLASGYLDLLRRRESDDVRLVIAGDGPYRAELEALLGESATFTGFLRGERLARLFASCDVFVFPSTTDTLGRAVAEAQASGLPAVVCGTGGPRECIQPGVSGFVVASGDDEGFFSRIEQLLDDDVLRERMGLAAREFAGTLSWETALEGILGLHHRVAGARKDLAASV